MSTDRRRSSRLLDSAVSGYVGAIAVLVGLWQIAPRSLLPANVVDRPAPVFRQVVTDFTEGDMLRHLWATSFLTVSGLVFGAVIGTTLGIVVGSNRWLRRWLTPSIDLAYAVPQALLISVYIFWFGIDYSARVTFVTSVIVFLFFYNVSSGVAEIDTGRHRMLRLLGASRRQVLRVLVVPTLADYIYSALRISVPVAYAAAIFSELKIVSSEHGLGIVLGNASRSLNPTGTIAAVAVIGAIGFVIDSIVVARIKTRAAAMGKGLR